LIPGGSAPDVTDQVKGETPPVADRGVPGNVPPAVAGGRDVVVIANGLITESTVNGDASDDRVNGPPEYEAPSEWDPEAE
jgi:hypothetical protein